MRSAACAVATRLSVGTTHRFSRSCVRAWVSSRVFQSAARRGGKKSGALGVEDRERGSRDATTTTGGGRGEGYLDGHVETNMATSSKDRYIPYIN